MLRIRTPLALASLFVVNLNAALAGGTGLIDKELRATRSLLIKNTLETNDPHMRACAALPKSQNLLDALRYSRNDEPVFVSGLTDGLAALPARQLRAAWCIPPRPSAGDMKPLALWYHNFFEIPRYADRQPVTYETLHHPLGLSGEALKATSVGGGSETINQKIASTSAKIMSSSAGYIVPLFSLPPALKQRDGNCAGYSLADGSIWTSIGDGGITGSGSLLQAGILFSLSCGKAGFPPITKLRSVASSCQPSNKL